MARFRSWHEKAIANDGQPYFIRWDNREMSRYGPQIDDADTGTYGLENPNPNPHSISNPSPSPGPHPDQAHMGSRCLTCRAPPRRSLPRCDNPDPASTRATRRDRVEIASRLRTSDRGGIATGPIHACDCYSIAVCMWSQRWSGRKESRSCTLGRLSTRRTTEIALNSENGVFQSVS